MFKKPNNILFTRLTKLVVEFSIKLTDIGTSKFTVFNVTCGNKTQIIELL